MLREVIGRGGLLLDCAVPGQPGRVRLTVQLDGSAFLRCTPAFAPAVADAASSAMTAATAALGDAVATLATVRAVLDFAVLGAAVLAALGSLLSAGLDWEGLWRPALVVVAYAGAIPLRGPLLRFALRRALRLALVPGRPG